jgi:hypothetical protein
VSDIPQDDALAIAQRLLKNTEERRLEWTPFIGGYEYEADSRQFTYFVKSVDQDDEAPYRLEVWKKQAGRSLKLVEITASFTEPLERPLRELYRAAKSVALNLDGLKNDVLRDLE